MLRALFEKTGNAIYISHLDLMRLFQRSFKRAGLALTHTQGYNPRPSVSIALPLSLGVESVCELLDFDLEGDKPSNEEILVRLNDALVDGVKILSVYDDGIKLKHLAYLDCVLTLEYDSGVSENAVDQIRALFAQPEIIVEKKGKTGLTEQNIAPMIRKMTVESSSLQELTIQARVCCQNPTLNPMQINAAIGKYIPELAPDFVRCRRLEVYDTNEKIFR